MPKRYLILTLSSLIFSLIVFSLLKVKSTYSAIAGHVVISEVQIGGDTANDEFIELYNPTNTAIDISGWSIQRETTSGTFAKKNFEEGDSIPAHGYFLIAHSDYTNVPVTPDMTHSSFTLSSTGTTVLLVNNQTQLTTGEEATIVDKVAIGVSALDPETTATPLPSAGGSIERKANSASTADSMGSGGTDEFQGNGEDTDNNANDFIVRTTSQPQNTGSSIESPTPPFPVTPPMNFVAFLSGANEVPPNASTASGTANLTFNFSNNTFDLNALVDGIALSDLTGSHIHVGTSGVSGEIIVDIGPPSDWQETSSITRVISGMSFPAEFIDELLAGNTYVNIHTTAYPSGEIRGQLVTPTPTQAETPTPTASETPTPAPSESPTPTASQSPTPTATESPTPTPTGALPETPTPTPTLTPTDTPTPTPSQTTTPTPTTAPTPTEIPTPTLTPTPTPPPTIAPRIIGAFIFPGTRINCSLQFTPVQFGFIKLFFPFVSCALAV